ncbi:MAG: hypothetical protein Q9208_007686 [Pyrenodesmia sp. 3 TL-2023]
MSGTSEWIEEDDDSMTIRSHHFKYRFPQPYDPARKILNQYLADTEAMRRLQGTLLSRTWNCKAGMESNMTGGQWYLEMGREMTRLWNKVTALSVELEAMEGTVKFGSMNHSVRLVQKPWPSYDRQDELFSERQLFDAGKCIQHDSGATRTGATTDLLWSQLHHSLARALLRLWMDPQTVPREFQPPPANSTQLPLTTFARPSAPSAITAINSKTSDSNGAATKKRRTSTAANPPPSSRGVANLTPEQLAKKRANDREAQRAIRERTKTQIENLEKELRELRNQQPHQELQAVLKQMQLVESENVHIKKKLSAALSLLQPLVGGNGTASSSKTAASITCLARLDIQNLSNASPTLNQQTVTSAPHSQQIPRSVSQMSDTASIRSRASSSPTFVVASPLQQHNQSPMTQSSSYTPQGSAYPAGSAPLDHQRNTLTHGLNMNTTGERLNLGFLLDGRSPGQDGGSPHSGPHMSPNFPHLVTNIHTSPTGVHTAKPHEGFSPPFVAHNVPIRNIPPTCPLDGILLDFLAERRARAAEGASPTNLVGPPYPSVSSLLNPERSMYAHPLSRVFTDILSKFPDLSALPEQVAVLYIMFLIMRWQIAPTQENYDRLPDWVTPRPSQLFTPHPAWVDHLPWPRMRDKMVLLYHGIPLDNWFIPFTTTLSLNWAYEPSDTLLAMPGTEGEFSINPVFERHLRDLGNWTLGPAFEKAFPGLADTCRIKREEKGRC